MDFKQESINLGLSNIRFEPKYFVITGGDGNGLGGMVGLTSSKLDLSLLEI